MKTTVRIAIGCALIWIIVNMIVYYTGYAIEAFPIMMLFNIFVLMCSIAAGLYLHKKDENFKQTIFLEDFKTGMQSGLMYAIIIASFVYLYHGYIDPSYREVKIEERMTALHEHVPDAAAYAELQQDDPTWQDKSFDDYIENQEDQFRGTYSASAVFIAHLMGFVFFSFFFTFFITLILRKVVLRGLR